MKEHAGEQGSDEGQTQSPTTYYGTARMQQMSGGTTSDSQPPSNDAGGTYGAARIAQLHGIGSGPAPGSAPLNDDAAE